MNLQKFIDILYSRKDYEESRDYYRKNGKDIFQNSKLLMAILDLEWSEKKNIMLTRLNGIISAEIINRNFFHKTHFSNILPIYIDFSEYMCNDCSFIGVPFNEWEELQKEYLDLLKIFIKEGKLGKHEKDSRLKDMYEKKFKLREKLLKKHPHLENPYGVYG